MRMLFTALKWIGGVVVVLILILVGMVMSMGPNVPDSRAALETASAGQHDPRPVLIFGATRNTGLEFARLLRERGQPVVAAVRPTSDRSLLEPLNVGFVVADAMDEVAVAAAMDAADYAAVVTTIGCFNCDPAPDFLGNRNIIDAAAAAGHRRLILVTSIGAGNSYDSVNLLTKFALRGVLPLKTQAEDYLLESGLDYTIIRPGGLGRTEYDPSGQAILSEDESAFGFINRIDLAGLMVAVLDDDRSIGKIYAAIDPTLEKPW